MGAKQTQAPERSDACGPVQDLLHAFLTNELEAEESKSVLEHLAGCSGCREAMAEHVQLLGLMRAHMPWLGKPYYQMYHGIRH